MLIDFIYMFSDFASLCHAFMTEITEVVRWNLAKVGDKLVIWLCMWTWVYYFVWLFYLGGLIHLLCYYFGAVDIEIL